MRVDDAKAVVIAGRRCSCRVRTCFNIGGVKLAAGRRCATADIAMRNALRLMKRAGAEAVKTPGRLGRSRDRGRGARGRQGRSIRARRRTSCSKPANSRCATSSWPMDDPPIRRTSGVSGWRSALFRHRRGRPKFVMRQCSRAGAMNTGTSISCPTRLPIWMASPGLSTPTPPSASSRRYTRTPTKRNCAPNAPRLMPRSSDKDPWYNIATGTKKGGRPSRRTRSSASKATTRIRFGFTVSITAPRGSSGASKPTPKRRPDVKRLNLAGRKTCRTAAASSKRCRPRRRRNIESCRTRSRPEVAS